MIRVTVVDSVRDYVVDEYLAESISIDGVDLTEQPERILIRIPLESG